MNANTTAKTTTDAGTLPDAWKTLLWRQDELERAGYPPDMAMTIAERLDVDLHEACDLVRAGATPQLAVAILL